MLAESAGFALLAAISPTALLVMAVFLGSTNPRVAAGMYVAGAVVMTVVMAITVLLLLRAVGLSQPREHTPRYGLRLGLGVVALALAAFVSSRGRRPLAGDRGPVASPAPVAHAAPVVGEAPVAGDGPVLSDSRAVSETTAKRPGLVARLTAKPRPLTAFLLGLLLYAPSATFIAAVQVIATANEGVPITVLAMLLVVLITAATIWLPLVTYLAFPDATTRTLRTANEWLCVHGRMLLTGALWVAGVALAVNGALGL